MKTARDLVMGGILALICLAPAVNADVAQALGEWPPAATVRDFDTAQLLSSENAAGIRAGLPRIIADLIRPLWAHAARR